MKKLVLTATAVAAAIAISSANAGWFSSSKSKTPELKTQMDKVSYTIGYQMGKSFDMQKIAAKPAVILAGMKAGMSGKKAAMTPAEMKTTMTTFQREMITKMMAKQKAEGAKNLKASDAFMAKIAKQAQPHKGLLGATKLIPGKVYKIENGLFFKIIKEGHGPKPTAQDHVKVNYSGALINGKVFDSSYKRGQPAVFGVSQVIPGWTKALEQMPEGSTWELYIAPKLAYGTMAPPTIGPNQALVFKVDLMKIMKPKHGTAPAHPKAPAHPVVLGHKK